jgi:hypothetical protein
MTAAFAQVAKQFMHRSIRRDEPMQPTLRSQARHANPKAPACPQLTRVTRAPGTATFGRRPAGHVPAAPFFPRLLSRALLVGRRPATPLRTKTKSVNGPLRALGRRGFSYASSAARVPTALKMLSQRKSVREHLQVGRAARRWQSLVGVRWQRWQCRVAAFYFQRISLPMQWWRAAGCPPQFRPSLPWWQPLVWRWLRLSGWRR